MFTRNLSLLILYCNGITPSQKLTWKWSENNIVIYRSNILDNLSSSKMCSRENPTNDAEILKNCFHLNKFQK